MKYDMPQVGHKHFIDTAAPDTSGPVIINRACPIGCRGSREYVAAVKALVGLLKEAHECVCDLLCPSTGKTGVPIKHGELCNRIREAIENVEGL